MMVGNQREKVGQPHAATGILVLPNRASINHETIGAFALILTPGAAVYPRNDAVCARHQRAKHAHELVSGRGWV